MRDSVPPLLQIRDSHVSQFPTSFNPQSHLYLFSSVPLRAEAAPAHRNILPFTYSGSRTSVEFTALELPAQECPLVGFAAGVGTA